MVLFLDLGACFVGFVMADSEISLIVASGAQKDWMSGRNFGCTYTTFLLLPTGAPQPPAGGFRTRRRKSELICSEKSEKEPLAHTRIRTQDLRSGSLPVETNVACAPKRTGCQEEFPLYIYNKWLSLVPAKMFSNVVL